MVRIIDRGRKVLAAHPHRGVLVVVVTCSPATVVVVMAGYAEDRPIGRPDIQGFFEASCPDVVHSFEEIGAA